MNLLLAFILASAVSAQDAKTAVDNWLLDDAKLGCKLGSAAETVHSESTTNGVNFHVVSLKDGGFVVTAGDTRLGPVLAFSSGDINEFKEGMPLHDLVAGGLASAKAIVNAPKPAGAEDSAQEKKWKNLLDTTKTRVAGATTLSDVRVAAMVKSYWNQKTAQSSSTTACYNYYTPNNYYCGCVATAIAQILRYYQYPAKTVALPTYTETCTVSGTAKELTTQGGKYNWSNMPFDPATLEKKGTLSTTYRKAIGKLCSDVGILVNMDYAASGSGAYAHDAVKAFAAFGLSAKFMAVSPKESLGGTDEMRNVMISNFDAGRPVLLGINASGLCGHAVVGDGYGYSDGCLYYHLNLGWGGTSDAWYLDDKINANGYTFNNVATIVYNIYTTEDAASVLCSGRVLNENGTVASGCEVKALDASGATVATATSNDKGIYVLTVPAGEYSIVTESGETSAKAKVKLVACSNNTVAGASVTRDFVAGNLANQDLTLKVGGAAEAESAPMRTIKVLLD